MKRVKKVFCENFKSVFDWLVQECEESDPDWRSLYRMGDPVKVEYQNEKNITETFWLFFMGFKKDEETGERHIFGLAYDNSSGSLGQREGDFISLDLSCIKYNARLMSILNKHLDGSDIISKKYSYD